MARFDLDGPQVMASRDALWIARSALECAGSTARWISGLGARRLNCALDRQFVMRRLDCALDWRIRSAHAGPVWSAQTRLRSGFPRDAGAEILFYAPHRTPRFNSALRAHPKRRHAAALQSASRLVSRNTPQNLEPSNLRTCKPVNNLSQEPSTLNHKPSTLDPSPDLP